MTTAPSVNNMIKTREAHGFLTRVPGQLLADPHDLEQLGRVGVEIDHVARFLGCRCRSP
jgi:hypothetical protein